jgi:uncharacterized protein with HEPN domain
MLESAREAISFVAGRQRRDLEEDRMLLRAVVQCIQVIGEAASRVSEETRSRVAELPWGKIVGMRNILVHAYFSIDTEVVWKVLKERLPELVTQVEAALKAWPQGD